MEFANVLKLAKAGFKPDEIKSFKDKNIDSDTLIELSKNGYTAGDVDALIALTSNDVDSIPPTDGDGNNGSENDGDRKGDNDNFNYKEENEKLKNEIDALKKTVENLQNDNAHKPLDTPEEKTNRDKVREIFKTIY